ncbi:isocitrate lyase/PEP mutase family protein [Altererythrobacter sp. BO-6]|uniref:isocitrate lyase/PEP mutase family protein n=1 Tax=Altererythrobacter sp. BO-6 TaxID=2604537 RepID=UPI0013E1FC65|nr:isocitrate lyase/PEP mutase family protein [Altererythrobacter sp. BO-6]QIG53625.1 isocitrate lyase/PEP mutase family protein [Altererythrobacter sp. BO-6]
MTGVSSQSAAAQLRHMLDTQDVVVAPGIYDHMSLLLAQAAGHKALYASGYWGTASALGEADVGIAGMSDFASVFGRFAARAKVPVIADADTGFGSLTNLRRAVQLYSHAGIAAMQIEDQPFPKICGHVGRATSVPSQEMVKRMQVAVEAREGGEMLIIARTDARRSEGLNSAIDRLAAYAEAGADVLFIEAPESEEEIAQAAGALAKPLMINAAHGGFTPILSPSGYAKLGARLVIYPAGAPLSALGAAAKFYAGLAADNANPSHDAMFDFKEISRLLGMEEIVAFQDRHGSA